MSEAIKGQTFGQAVEAMKAGKLVSREGWAEKGLVVFMQVPSEVPAEIIPRMTSLPPDVKALASSRGLPLQYTDQLAIMRSDNGVRGWAPSVGDALATDWNIHNAFTVAGETVGTAKPL